MPMPDDRKVEILVEERERLAREMGEGYRFEAELPSLEPEWAAFEAEGLPPEER